MFLLLSNHFSDLNVNPAVILIFPGKKKEEEVKTQGELAAGQTTIRFDKDGKLLPRIILQTHLHQVENIRIGFSLRKGIFGSIYLIALQKCKLRMALKFCKKQLDAAGCSALCNSMMHLIGEFVLGVKLSLW